MRVYCQHLIQKSRKCTKGKYIANVNHCVGELTGNDLKKQVKCFDISLRIHDKILKERGCL